METCSCDQEIIYFAKKSIDDQPGVAKKYALKKANNTGCSQVVSHPGTNPAQGCLTLVFGWEPVLSAWCGRWLDDNSRDAVLE